MGVTNGGCAGMSYTMEYASEAKPFEEVMEDKGVKIFIDPKAILFLIGTELDFVQEKLGARFVFNNPNQTCGLRLRRKRVRSRRRRRGHTVMTAIAGRSQVEIATVDRFGCRSPGMTDLRSVISR